MIELLDDHGLCYMCGRNPAPPSMVCESCEASIEQMDPALDDGGVWDRGDDEDAPQQEAA